ncbi:Salicylate hydroxylase, partial [Tolypocladium paradoxum]
MAPPGKFLYAGTGAGFETAAATNASGVTIAALPRLLVHDTKAKIAVVGADGIVRGKLISKSKFLSVASSCFGFSSVMFGWYMHDRICIRGSLRFRMRGLGTKIFRRIPWEDNVAVLLVNLFAPETKQLIWACPRGVLKRQLEHLVRDCLGDGAPDWPGPDGLEGPAVGPDDATGRLPRRALVNLIPDGTAHFGKRLQSLEETSAGVGLSIEDGSSVVADVVVGCDGIRSKVKESMLPEEVEQTKPRYSGMYSYRAILDMDTMVDAVGDRRARVSTLYVAKGAYATSSLIMRVKKCICPTYPNGLSSNTRIFLQSRVAILGDAVYTSTPYQGAGAGQAIEDAYLLAELLSDLVVTTPRHVIAAFRVYDAVRRPRSQRVVTSSKENAQLLCLCYAGVSGDELKLRETWQVEEQAEEARKVMLDLLATMDWDRIAISV